MNIFVKSRSDREINLLFIILMFSHTYFISYVSYRFSWFMLKFLLFKALLLDKMSGLGLVNFDQYYFDAQHIFHPIHNMNLTSCINHGHFD